MIKTKSYPVLYYANEDEVEQFQLEQIRKAVNYAIENTKYYRKMLKNISGRDIKTLNDFRNIVPVTTKKDLLKNYWDFVGVDKKQWVDVLKSSGTTNTPIYIPVTKHDLRRLAIARAINLDIAGITRNDIVQITLPLSSFMWFGGLDQWLGLNYLGACAVRFGPGFTEQQIQNLYKLEVTAIIGNASFLLKLGNIIIKNEMMKKLNKVRLISVGEQNIMEKNGTRNRLGRSLEQTWSQAHVSASYSATEIGAIGRECEEKKGYHLLPDMYYLEILDAKTLKLLENSQEGLVVVTPFNRKGMPLIRYALGDISFLMKGKCSCGRTTPRLGPILKKIDGMIKIKGVSIYPLMLNDIISSIDNVGLYYIEVYTDKDGIDQIRIIIEEKLDFKRGRQDLIEKIKVTLREKLGIGVNVIFCARQKILNRFKSQAGCKLKHFFDMRRK